MPHDTHKAIAPQLMSDVIARIEAKEYASPYHDEPMNETLEDLQIATDAPHIADLIVNKLPYIFADAIADRSDEERERLQSLYIDFAKSSIDQILQFEFAEY